MRARLNLFLIAGIIFSALAVSCGSSEVSVKNYKNPALLFPKSPKNMTKALPEMSDDIVIPSKATFYESSIDRISVEGQVSGLPEGVKQVYLSLFTDHANNVEVQREFDKILKDKLAGYGLQMMTKIKSAQLIVYGNIDAFFTEESRLVTNIEGLIYTMKISYSVEDNIGKTIQDKKYIEQSYLVKNTNTYMSNIVIPLLIDLVAGRTAEAVYYGWQLQFSSISGKIEILGEDN